MKFIHTAYIHLDSPLSGLAAYKDAPVDLLRTLTSCLHFLKQNHASRDSKNGKFAGHPDS